MKVSSVVLAGAWYETFVTRGLTMFSRCGLTVLLLLVALAEGIAGERTWTSTDGRTIRAEFIRELDGEVTLLKDGKIVTLPLERLCERDRQIVRDLAEGKSVPEEADPASPANTNSDARTASESGASAPSAAASESTSPQPLVKKPLPIENRTWTDIHGNQITGKYVRINGSNVVLLRGGKSVSVAFYELSSEDQEYLRELLTSRGEEGVIPSRVDAQSLVGDEPAGDAANEPANLPPAAGAARPGPRGGAPAVSGIPGAGGAAPAAGGPSFPGPGSSFPAGGPGFPGAGAGGSFPPTGPGSSPPGFGPSGRPGLAPPGISPPGTAGSSFPPSSPPGFPGGGSGFPGSTPGMPSTGPGFPTPPSAMPPSAMPGSAPGFPSSPPGFPGSTPGTAGSSFDRLNDQLERSRQQQLDSMQRMQDRLNEQHQSLFNRKTGECLACNRTLTDAQMRGTKCPHCGVTWDYEIDEFGNKRDLNNSSFASPFVVGNNGGGAANQPLDAKSARLIGLVLAGLIGFAVVVGMIIGTVYIIMSIASANSSSQQRMYR